MPSRKEGVNDFVVFFWGYYKSLRSDRMVIAGVG